MTTIEENIRLTRVGPGTSMGDTMRRYWVPFALSTDLSENDGAPVRVRVLGEDLVAFRDTHGDVGLVDALCAHRRAPLFFGRNEECGIRCIYHGWKFDRTGNCVDIPSEPEFSRLQQHVTLKAYPAWEAGGLLWAYMGPRSLEPPHPDYEWLRVPESHFHISKCFQACNYLQAMEGGIDNVHGSFLHSNHMGNPNERKLLNSDRRPRLDVEDTPWGYRYASTRQAPEGRQYVRVAQFVMPFMQMRGRMMDFSGTVDKAPSVRGHIWVPIDDVTTCVYNWVYGRDASVPITLEDWEEIEEIAGRGHDAFLPDSFWPRRNLGNDYLVDRFVQKTQTYSGIDGINTQDMAVQEGMGPISPRHEERLGSTDAAVIAARRLLLEATYAVQDGKEPRGVDPFTHSLARGGDALIDAGEHWTDGMAQVLTPTW